MFCLESTGNELGQPDMRVAEIRSFVDAFNENRFTYVVPGRIVCVDELMSQWEGKELKYHPLGCPHVTKLPRKPVSCCVEGKCTCCGESGIMVIRNKSI